MNKQQQTIIGILTTIFFFFFNCYFWCNEMFQMNILRKQNLSLNDIAKRTNRSFQEASWLLNKDMSNA